MILIWSARFMFRTELVYYILSILAGFFSVLLWIPFYSIVYGIAKGDKTDEFIIFREIPLALGRILLFSSAIVLSGKLEYSFLVIILSLIIFIPFARKVDFNK